MKHLLNTYVYVVSPEWLAHFQYEVPDVVAQYGNLIFAQSQCQNVVFAEDIWLTPHLLSCPSIGQGSSALRALGLRWVPFLLEKQRRTLLIQEKLARFREPSREFPFTTYPQWVGQYGLLDQDTIIASAKRWKRFPSGSFEVVENKISPPNRAYLKLWEALSLCDAMPKAGDLALDLGSSPGGWTWVLQSLGARVVSVDKAPLAPHIAALPRIEYRQDSAFAIDPNTLGTVDWLVCDVACYPDRLWTLVNQWLNAGTVRHIIATIKLQGDTDWESIRRFQQIPQGKVVHLTQNKHEVTFIWPSSGRLQWEEWAPVVGD